MMCRFLASAVLLLLTAALAWGCAKPEKQDQVEARAREEAGARLLARVDDTALTVATYEAAVTQLPPFLREALQGESAYLRFFGDQIAFTLLANEARRQGLTSDPGVQIETRKALREALEAKVKDAVVAPPLSDAALAEARAATPMSAKRVVVELLAQRDPARARRLAVAYQLARGATLGLPEATAVAIFGRLARAKSFEIGVDTTLGPLSIADADVVAAAPLVELALAGDEIGLLLGPVETVDGVYLLMRSEILPPQPLSDAELRGKVTREWLEAAQQRAIERLHEETLGAAKVEILDPSLRP